MNAEPSSIAQPTLQPTPEVDLKVVLHLDPNLAHRAELQPLFDKRMTELAAMGAWGAFAGSHFRPSTSRVTLVTSKHAPDRFTYQFSLVHTAPLFTEVIESLVQHLRVKQPGILDLQVLQTQTRDNKSTPPPYLEPYPFDVEFRASSSDLRVKVDFDGKCRPEDLADFEYAWKAWQAICAAGGFPTPASEQSHETSPLTVVQHPRLERASMSACYSHVDLPDTAFHGLFNQFSALHDRLAAIDCVVIR